MDHFKIKQEKIMLYYNYLSQEILKCYLRKYNPKVY